MAVQAVYSIEIDSLLGSLQRRERKARAHFVYFVFNQCRYLRCYVDVNGPLVIYSTNLPNHVGLFFLQI